MSAVQGTHQKDRALSLRRAAPWLAVVLVPLIVAGLVLAAVIAPGAGGERVAGMIVNEDQMVTQTDADGEEQFVLAGRLLVTALTDPEQQSLDWTLATREQAEAALAAGSTEVVVIIPEDFSDAVLSLSGDAPRQARFEVLTDDSHSYLSGVAVEAVSGSLASAFGQQLTQQYLVGVYDSIGGFGSALAEAADGAEALAEGGDALGAGLREIGSGAYSAADGAGAFRDGLKQYTGGVSQLSSQFGQLAAGAAQLGDYATLLQSYSSGVADATAALNSAYAALMADPGDADAWTQLAIAQATLDGVNAYSSAVGQGAPGVAQLAGGLPRLASAMQQLSASGPGLLDGAASLQQGIRQLAGGVTSVADGADELTSGIGSLAGGLRDGSDQVPAFDAAQIEDAAAVASAPIEAEVHRANALEEPALPLLAFALPLALWLGILAWMLLYRPFTRARLESTATVPRLLAIAAGPLLLTAAVQAVLVIAVAIPVLGLNWAGVPALLGIALLAGGTFALAQLFLVSLAPRFGLLLALLLGVVQLLASGGLFPLEIMAAGYDLIAPFTPVHHAVVAAQAVLAGADVGQWLPPMLILLGMALGAAALTLWRLASLRRPRSSSPARPVRGDAAASSTGADGPAGEGPGAASGSSSPSRRTPALT